MLWLEAIGCERHGGPVLDNVTFGVSAGELVVVEGSQASGKSTLLEVAAGARFPDRGAVWFAGRSTTTLQRASMPFVRRNIGFYTAEALLVAEDTVLANVMAALAVRGQPYAAAAATAQDALALVRASDLAERKAGSLSTGQRRIVALARALAGPPPLVVADEPAALLGDEARALVIAALVTVRDAGAAVLTATADAALANVLVTAGGRRIHLAEGRIVGAPAVGLVPDLPESPAERPRLLPLDDAPADREVLSPTVKSPR